MVLRVVFDELREPQRPGQEASREVWLRFYEARAEWRGLLALRDLCAFAERQVELGPPPEHPGPKAGDGDYWAYVEDLGDWRSLEVSLEIRDRERNLGQRWV